MVNTPAFVGKRIRVTRGGRTVVSIRHVRNAPADGPGGSRWRFFVHSRLAGVSIYNLPVAVRGSRPDDARGFASTDIPQLIIRSEDRWRGTRRCNRDGS